ncbi:MAG: phenylalanine--tRNA ligase subunit beta [Myxococcota bacterium]
MRASTQWLKELTGIDASPEELAEKLTAIGLEVDEFHRFDPPEGVVVAEIKTKKVHPTKDKYTVVELFDGKEDVTVLCGAPNVPEPGGHVLFARVGAKLPIGPEGALVELGAKKIAGVESRGMICSEPELNLGADGVGIIVLGSDAPAPGTPLSDALPVGDVVLEIGLTPNRPDCLGHIGIARDLAAVYGVPFTAPDVDAPAIWAEGVTTVVPATAERVSLPWKGGKEVALEGDDSGIGPFAVQIDDAERCPRYGAAFVINAKVQPSPFALRYRLHVLGLRSINNLVDVTNLVMLETGHPIHGFDGTTLEGKRIVVRTAHEGETMTTLDEVERKLLPTDLLICDGNKPVAIAGVMGGLNSEISDTTKHVVIECAYFDPRSVRRTSRRLDLHTDASHRFERGVDPNDVPYVLARAASLMAQVSGPGTFALRDAIDANPAPIERRTLTLRRSVLRGLLGIEVPSDRVTAILGALGCEIVEETEDAVTVRAPSWRPDLGAYASAGEADLVEEVGRIYGYDKIPFEVPRVSPSREGTPARILFERALREAGTAAGLSEAVTYAFVSPEDLRKARVSTDATPVRNPLSSDRSVLRTSLLPGLAGIASRSLHRQAGEVAVFELGRVFTPGAELPAERTVLSLMLAGRRGGWIGDERSIDFYDLKGALEVLARWMGGTLTLAVHEALSVHEALHPKRRAQILVDGHEVGFLGELHPDVSDDLEIDGRAQFAELDVAKLRAAIEESGAPQAIEPPRVPAVTRDVSLALAEEITAGAVISTLREAAGGLAESVELFDLFRGGALPAGTKAMGFRIRYRDPSATLTDKKVDKVHAKAVKAAEKAHSATVR